MEFYRGKMGLRELYSLFWGLPNSSRTICLLAGDEEARQWRDETYLQADTVDLLKAIFRVLWVGQQLKGNPPTMEQTYRPDFGLVVEEAKQEARIAYLDQFRG